VRTERIAVQSSLAPAAFIDALKQSAAAVEQRSAYSFDLGATLQVAADAHSVSIAVLPHVRRFVPRFIGLIEDSGTGSFLTGAIEPTPLARISWYVFIAGAIWVAASSLVFTRFQGATWSISLATAVTMSALGTGFLVFAHWLLWGSTARDRALIRAILTSAGCIQDLDKPRVAAQTPMRRTSNER
jgi:hypothetical protein